MFENMYSIGVVNPKLKTGEMQLRCNYEDGTWYLFAQLPQMSKVEAMNIQTGKISLAFAIIEDELFLLGKFGVLDWFGLTCHMNQQDSRNRRNTLNFLQNPALLLSLLERILILVWLRLLEHLV